MNRTTHVIFSLLLPVVTVLGSSQTPLVSSCFRADGDTYPVRFGAVRLSNVIYGQEMTMMFTMTTDEELGDQPTLTIDMLKPYTYDMSCKKNFGSCEYPMCGPFIKEDSRNFVDFLESECPIRPGAYTLTITATVPNASDFTKHFKTCRGDEEVGESVCLAKAAEHNAAKLRRTELRAKPWLFENREHVCTRTHMSKKNKTLPVLITVQNGGEPVGCNTFYMTVSE
uniref:ML domain containing protein n=1 Tax=Rhipicephalus zambeziensis TaxID=60191 RepID=A0A224YF21_9ACAR